MLTADIEGGTAYGATTKGYNVYRDDRLIAQSVTATGYNDVAPAPGSYVYSVEAVADNGNVSERTVAKATAKLPAADRDIMIGYHLTYANGVKPMLFDAGPADDGYGNLLSASAGDTSWKTLKSLNKSLDGNWRIYATPAAPDRRSAKAAAGEDSDAVTYNIYRDGVKIVSGVTATSYDFPENGMTGGTYHVTAENAGIESAASNKVYVGLGGVSDIVADGMQAYYDAASRNVILPSAETFGTVYNASGVKVASGSGKISLAGAPAGLYMLSVDGSADALKFVVR